MSVSLSSMDLPIKNYWKDLQLKLLRYPFQAYQILKQPHFEENIRIL